MYEENFSLTTISFLYCIFIYIYKYSITWSLKLLVVFLRGKSNSIIGEFVDYLYIDQSCLQILLFKEIDIGLFTSWFHIGSRVFLLFFLNLF